MISLVFRSFVFHSCSLFLTRSKIQISNSRRVEEGEDGWLVRCEQKEHKPLGEYLSQLARTLAQAKTNGNPSLHKCLICREEEKEREMDFDERSTPFPLGLSTNADFFLAFLDLFDLSCFSLPFWLFFFVVLLI